MLNNNIGGVNLQQTSYKNIGSSQTKNNLNTNRSN